MENENTKTELYMKNPDVVLHEEDEDGALVFNPDNDKIRVLNRTGHFIWSTCDGQKDLEGIINAVKNAFSDVPEDQVVDQVKSFIDDMLSLGFIGTVEE